MFGADGPGGMIDTQTGRVEAGSAVITKASLFQQWKAVGQLSLGDGSYQSCKERALEYCRAIDVFRNYCKARILGTWITRGSAVDQFI